MTKHAGPDTESVREDWSRRGRHWNARADEVAKFSDRFNVPLMDAADIRENHHVLDLAAGAGEPMMSVARRVGPAGSVLACDLVPEMLEGARRRAGEADIANVSFRINDMCELPDADATFDRAICRFGLMFAPDPVRAAGEAARVLKPGGKAAYLVWGPRADTTMFEVFAAAADEIWGRDDPLVDLQTMCRLGGDGDLNGILEAGGFARAEERDLRFQTQMPGDIEFWHVQIDMSFGPKMEAAPESERQALRDAIRGKFQHYLKDGAYHVAAHARIGIGIKA